MLFCCKKLYMFINLQIKSKNKTALKILIQFFIRLKYCQKFNFKSNLNYFLKNSKHKIFTILKSPHVNKTAQKQVRCSMNVIEFSLNTLQFFKILVILKKLQKNVGFEFHLTSKFIVNLNSKKQSLLKFLKFYKYENSIFYNVGTVINLFYKKYLNLFQIYGNLSYNFV